MSTIPSNIVNIEPIDSNLIKVKSLDINFGIRYGHKMKVHESKLFVFGGFGELVNDLSGKHMRHGPIEIIDLNTLKISVLNSINGL
jgi:hypothetical protein